MNTTPESTSDIIVVGGGHNALVCAAYLAEAGLKVAVLEGRELIGGNTITEELMLPGWKHDSCSTAHVVIQANPLIKNDELGIMSKYGLEYIITDPAAVIPVEGGESIIIHSNLDATVAEFARWSEKDGQALRDIMAEWAGGLNTAHAYYSSGLEAPEGVPSEKYHELRLGTAWGFITDRFEHPVVRQAMLWMAFSTLASPVEPGSGILPMVMMSGRIANGWTTPVGGSGALPNALAAHVTDHGGTVVTDAWVEKFIVEDGRCVGVRTADGREYRAARAVVSSAHLRELQNMLDVPSALAQDAMSRWRPGLSAFAVHFALRKNAAYRTREGVTFAAAGGLGTNEGILNQMKQVALGTVETESPWLLMMSTTVVDPDRVPEGHGVFKFLTVAPELLDGKPWTEEDGERYARRLVEIARDYVDGLDDDDILAMSVETPTTLAAHNRSNIGGSCHGGEFVMDDGIAVRGWPEYRADIPGLYLTGSTAHPGGSVTGRPGRNAARVILDDLGIGASTVMSTP